jgi:hypothetical protein
MKQRVKAWYAKEVELDDKIARSIIYLCMLQMVMEASMCSLLLYDALGIP